MLIGIAGKAGAGKDTLADWLVEKRGYEKQGLADPIKAMLNVLFSSDDKDWLNREWKEAIHLVFGFSPRQAAQKLGTEWRDTMDPTKMMWCNWMEDDWERYDFDKELTVIPDIRFPHEQDWVHSHGGVVIEVRRSMAVEVAAHSSETSLDPAKVDLVVENNASLVEFLTKLPGVWADLEYIKGVDHD